MAISILTFQDEPDGSVSIGFTTEPVIDESEPLSNALILGLMSFHNALQELQEVEENDSSSKMEE